MRNKEIMFHFSLSFTHRDRKENNEKNKEIQLQFDLYILNEKLMQSQISLKCRYKIENRITHAILPFNLFRHPYGDYTTV